MQSTTVTSVRGGWLTSGLLSSGPNHASSSCLKLQKPTTLQSATHSFGFSVDLPSEQRLPTAVASCISALIDPIGSLEGRTNHCTGEFFYPRRQSHKHRVKRMAATNSAASTPGVVDSPRLQDVVGEKMEDALRRVLFHPVPGAQPFKDNEKITTKITVVGVGNVGMACAQTILTQDLCGEIALVDVVADKLRGEMLDLQHGAAFMNRAKIVAGTDYKVTAGSDVCVITAGARQKEGESRLSLVGRNVNLLKSIIPELVKYSPDTILLLVSNPVDVLTHCAWKISGFPPNRVIGSGTNLDSSRFRFLIADALDINAQNVHAHIVGEHGDSSVPMWSSAQIAGIPLVQYARAKNVKLTDEVLDSIHKQVVNGAYEVIKLKGYTSWAIGYSVASLIRTILHDTHRVHPVSVPAKGLHGIKEDVYLSLPALLGRQGLLNVMEQEMSENERAMLHKSAKGLADVIAGLDNL